jgi:endoglucanase
MYSQLSSAHLRSSLSHHLLALIHLSQKLEFSHTLSLTNCVKPLCFSLTAAMKDYLFLLSVAFLLSCCQITQAADTCATLTEITGGTVDSTGFVTTHGKPKLNSIQLVDAYDVPLQLIGVSSHNILIFSSCYTFEALSHLVTNWGITSFRVTVYLEGSQGYMSDPAGNDVAIANIIDWCETLGIYAIIDYHVMEYGDPNHYLDSQGASTGHAITFWQKQATAYQNKDHVIYEIANEPNNVDWEPNLVAYLNSVIAAIRAIDAETIIIAGVPQWSQALYYPGNDGGVTDTYNVMYAFHFYADSHLFLYSVVEQYSRILPIFVSEWSPSSYTSVEEPNLPNSDKFTELFSGILPDNPITLSSSAWAWVDKGGEEVSLLTSGSCGSQSWTSLTCAGKYIKNYIHTYRLLAPSVAPSAVPSDDGTTVAPTVAPTVTPSLVPTVAPSATPSTSQPSVYTDSCVADASLLVKVHKK